MGGWPEFGNNDLGSLLSPMNQIDEENNFSEEEVIEEQEEDIQVEPVKAVKRGRKAKDSKGDEEKLTEYRSAKYSDRQIRQLENIKRALKTTNDGEALRWILDAGYKANKRKIERIVEEMQRIETL